MKTPATSPVRSLTPSPSSNRAAIASASKCYSLTSSASLGSVAYVCAARAAPSLSSHSPRSRRICAASPSCWPDHRHRPLRALRKRRVRRCQCVEAVAPSGAHGDKGSRKSSCFLAPFQLPTSATKSATSGRRPVGNGEDQSYQSNRGCASQQNRFVQWQRWVSSDALHATPPSPVCLQYRT